MSGAEALAAIRARAEVVGGYAYTNWDKRTLASAHDVPALLRALDVALADRAGVLAEHRLDYLDETTCKCGWRVADPNDYWHSEHPEHVAEVLAAAANAAVAEALRRQG